jgi:hypothetical protein
MSNTPNCLVHPPRHYKSFSHNALRHAWWRGGSKGSWGVLVEPGVNGVGYAKSRANRPPRAKTGDPVAQPPRRLIRFSGNHLRRRTRPAAPLFARHLRVAPPCLSPTKKPLSARHLVLSSRCATGGFASPRNGKEGFVIHSGSPSMHRF